MADSAQQQKRFSPVLPLHFELYVTDVCQAETDLCAATLPPLSGRSFIRVHITPQGISS